jgi:hypothetical protein
MVSIKGDIRLFYPQISLLTQLSDHLLKLFIPGFTETLNKGILQKLPNGKIESLALLYSITANGPAIVIQGYGTVRQGCLTNGIEIAGYGFTPCSFASTESLFTSTETSPIVTIAGKAAIASINNARNQVAIAITISHALRL